MKVLTIHNRYKFRGGEDESRESEDCVLASKGHSIREILLDNREIPAAGSFLVGMKACWSQESYRRVRKAIDEWRPDILDVHNFFPLASPSVHYAGRSRKIPVVQTLHNYRLLCASATFFRQGKTCEDCTGCLGPWPGVIHGCYRNSKLQTGAVALMIAVHRLLRTWHRAVSLFIAVSEFEKRKFVESGFPESIIQVKPNPVAEPGPPPARGDSFLYVGRLSKEKGVGTLLQAANLFSDGVRLRIVGQGPLESDVRAAASRNPRIEFLGPLPQKRVLHLIGEAKSLVLPSECYETFGRVAAEAFACGTPVLASRIGAIAEIVAHGRTGLQFRPGDPADLARAIAYMQSNPDRVAEMRVHARQEYEAKFTFERNYQLLMAAYERATENCRKENPARNAPAPSSRLTDGC